MTCVHGVPLNHPCDDCLAAIPINQEVDQSRDGLLAELRSLSSQVGAGLAENETDPMKLIERIRWGVDHIGQVEAARSADLIEELSKTPKTTWGQVRTAVLNRHGPQPSALSRPSPDVVEIDLEKSFFATLAEAASQSSWIPQEHYFANDWVADCAEFLRTGEGVSRPSLEPTLGSHTEGVEAWRRVHEGMRRFGMESTDIDTVADHFASIQEGTNNGHDR